MRKFMVLRVLFFLFLIVISNFSLIFSNTFSYADEAWFTATEYAWILSDVPDGTNLNSTGIPVYLNDPSAGSSYGLLKFDLRGIPADSAINSVDLVLNCDRDDGIEVTISNCTSNWSHNSVSWNNRPGSGSLTATTYSSGIGTWQFSDRDFPDIVKNWVDNSSTNNGLYILPQSTGGMARFSSSDSAVNIRNRPQLFVTYTQPPPDPDLLTIQAPSSVREGVPFTVTVSAENDGGVSPEGAINASVLYSDGTDDLVLNGISASWADGTYNRTPGYYPIYNNNCQAMTAQDHMVEVVSSDWQNHDNYSMSFTVTPQKAGTLYVRVRTTMRNGPVENCDYRNDTSSASSRGTNGTDQQGWLCRVYTVSVEGEPIDPDNDGYTIEEGDCNNDNPSIHPGAVEICNDIDDNCNGSVDEDVGYTYYRDSDGDGYGDASQTTYACTTLSGYSSNSNDCNDNNPAVHPGATEICNGMDDDCDNSVDEGVTTTYYYDDDGDGYGNASHTTQACSRPSEYASNSDDCDDSNSSVHPGAVEICNEIDDDCDGSVDEGVRNTYYRDVDGDGYGDENQVTQECSEPSGYASNSDDCNDNNSAVHPGATEICNGINDDCDGPTDEGCGCTEGDTQPTTCGSSIGACQRGSGFVTCVNGDWDNDTCVPLISPTAEICDDGIDQDCNGSDCTNDTAVDNDNDGYTTDVDCNDNNSSIHPGVEEICYDNIDQNCDGEIDEGCENESYGDDENSGGSGGGGCFISSVVKNIMGVGAGSLFEN